MANPPSLSPRARLHALLVPWLVAAVALATLTVASGASAASRSHVKARWPDAVAKAGERLVVTGRVRPKAKRTVVLQRRTSDHWTKVRKERSTPKGRFALRVPSQKSGRAVYRVKVVRTPGLSRDVTRTQRIIVRRPQSERAGNRGTGSPASPSTGTTATVPATRAPATPATKTPSPTATPVPSPTATPVPSPTATPVPSRTVTQVPLAGAPFLPYSVGSYFRTPVAAGAVDAGLTASFRSFMASHPDQKGTPYPVLRGAGGNAWGTAYAEAGASDPVWRLTGAVPADVADLKTTGFRAPEWLGQVLTGTSDSPFVVLDRASGISVWGAKASVVGERLISVGAAGKFEHASNGLDKRNPGSDSDVNFRSRGAIPDAMVIRKDLVDYAVKTGGDLGHVLHLFFVETDTSKGHVTPMTGHESDKFGWGAEGQRLAVDPAVNLATRSCSPEALVIAKTLQRYGAYIGDNAGGASSFKLEQETSARPVWGGRLTTDSLKGCISWNDFVAVSG